MRSININGAATLQASPVATGAVCDMTAHEFMARLHRGGTAAHYWIPSDRGGISTWFLVGDAKPWPDARVNNVYFGISPVAEMPKAKAKYRRATNETVSVINCLYAEFDAKDFADKGAALAHVEALTPAPSAIVDSGGGFHCYWWLDDTLRIGDDAHRLEVRAYQMGWVDFVGADGGAKDLARVLRVPGTFNHKYDPPREVQIVGGTGQAYAIETLTEAAKAQIDTARDNLARKDGKTQHRGTTGGTVAPVATNKDDADLLDVLFRIKGGDKWRALWGGDMGAYSNDESSADCALIHKIMWLTDCDADRADRICKSSPYYQGKDDYHLAKWDRLFGERAADARADLGGKGYQGKPSQNGTGPAYDVNTDNAQAWGINGASVATEGSAEASQGAQGSAEGKAKGKTKGKGTPSPAPAQDTRLVSEIIEDDLSILGYTPALNELDGSVEVNGEQLTGPLEAEIELDARDLGYGDTSERGGKPSLAALRTAVQAFARRNRYHPIRDYLDGLKWDGKDHIGDLAYYFVDNHPPIIYADGSGQTHFRAVFTRWIVGAVARVFSTTGAVRPQNPVLVFVGGQGLGKSTFARWVCPREEWQVESPIDPGNKDIQRLLMTKLVWEVGEIGSTIRKADRDALKHFLTVGDVEIRLPYDKHNTRRPALASFIGTLNLEHAGYLSDVTGHRRFVTVELTDINHAYAQRVDVAQLWAQAVAMYRADPDCYRPTTEESAAIRAANEAQQVGGPFAETVEYLFDIDPDRADWFMPTGAITDRLVSVGRVSNTAGLSKQVASTLQQMGLQKARRRVDGNQNPVMGYTGICAHDLADRREYHEINESETGAGVADLDFVDL